MTNHKKALVSVASEAARQAATRYKALNPDAQGLRLKATVAAYKPRPKEVRDLPVKAVSLFLHDPVYLSRANAEIVSELGKSVGRQVPANILTERLKPRQIAAINQLLEQRQMDLDLALHDTPSKIKKALKGALKAATASTKFMREIAITEEAVVVGGRAYPIQRGNGVARIHVGKSKLNVDTLKRLLTG